MRILRHIGGILRLGPREYLKRVWYLREFRDGTLVGHDQLGNKYYELTDDAEGLPFYRKRYVQLAGGSDDSSRVPAEWHAWLHYTNDDAPSRVPHAYPSYPWLQGHTPNWTGTERRYVPYSTTARKIVPFAWDRLVAANAFVLGNPALPSRGSPARQNGQDGIRALP